jgi:hypothetical protein
LAHYKFLLVGQVAEDRAKTPPHRSTIPADLRPVYAEVVAVASELRAAGLSHRAICDELNRRGFRTRTGLPWRHPQQVVKLLRSFGGK